jgi:hypothetical protein
MASWDELSASVITAGWNFDEIPAELDVPNQLVIDFLSR